MDNREFLFMHERRWAGLYSELRIEARDGRPSELSIKDFPTRGLSFSIFHEWWESEFFDWVSDNANDKIWLNTVSDQWEPVDSGGSTPE